MTEREGSKIPAGRRCQNCGSRVAQNAASCYFCGHELTGNARKRPARLTLRDVTLVLILLAVVIAWWQFGWQGYDSQLSAESSNGSSSSASGTVDAPPPTAEEGEQQPGADVQRHNVREGDTLLEIAAMYGVTVEDIQAANSLDGTLIRAGEELLIPIPISITDNGNGNSNGTAIVPTIFSYKVMPGDTVISIAVRLGTNVASIQEANGLGADDIIRPDQLLQVPIAGVPSMILETGEAAPAGQSSEPGQVYGSLQLLGPEDGQIIPRSEDLLFRWLSGGLLQQNEWYVLYIWPLEGLAELPLPVWTKVTSYRLPNQWAPQPGRAVTYRWQTSVVRVLTNAQREYSIEAASDPSEVRSFVWFGGAN